MPSQLSIVNRALIALGQEPVLTISEQSKGARLCAALWDGARDSCLEDHDWKFASRRVELALLDETPLLRSDYLFQLPADCLRVREVDDETQGWSVEYGRLYYHSDAVTIRYTARVIEPGRFSPQFGDALSLRLAASMALSFGQDRRSQEALWQQYRWTLAHAAYLDCLEGKPVTDDTTDSWIAARSLT